MSQILVLSKKEIESLLTLPIAIESAEAAYIAKHNGTGTLFPLVSHEFFSGAGELDIKSGHLRTSRVYGLKLISWFAENPDFSLPASFATALLFDDRTGEPQALLNASGLTNMRVGASVAISTKLLARKHSDTLLIVGMGELAPYLAAAAVSVLPSLRKVLLYNPHGIEKAKARKKDFLSRMESLLEAAGAHLPPDIRLVEDLAQATGESDVIITATPSRIPLIQDAWVKPGTHLCAIGADMSGKQELDSFILSKAKVYVDDKEHAVNVGESEIPVRHGVLSQDSLCEIAELVAAKQTPLRSEEEITVFDATGLSLQDISISKRVFELAVRAGVGTRIEL